jgi:hypothetical protein
MEVAMNTLPVPEATESLVRLDPLERRVIVYLRLLRSTTGRREIEHDLVARAGSGTERTLDHLEGLERLMARAIKRPLVIGSIDDGRATKDEMVLAQLIGAAADRSAAKCRRRASWIAGEVDHARLARAAELVASLIAPVEVARCSCGRTSADHDRSSYGC